MRLNNVRKSIKNLNDEMYTPRILIEPIIKYLKPHSTILCPFDTESSEFVKVFSENEFYVVYSHISFGTDFFKCSDRQLNNCDYIISNPPFSRKLEVLERLYQIGKPFAMILGLPILNYQEIGNFFIDKKLQLLIFDKKVSFNGKTASFNNSYFCKDILPQDIIFEHLPHNNTGKNFVPSRMKI